MPVRLIWDNAARQLTVPPEMGTPAPGQLAGSDLDNLCELAGRVCYQSLGKGRNSVEYHQHIREVVNLSVYRHATFTVEVPKVDQPAATWPNRPGLWLGEDAGVWRVTLNLQHIIEWPLWGLARRYDPYLHRDLCWLARVQAPLACGDLAQHPTENTEAGRVRFVLPESDHERWLSFYVHGVSRGLSHELVRHGAFCAPSQRSTRYCDEDETPWVWHPLMSEVSLGTLAAANAVRDQAREVYTRIVEELTARGHGRKSARGAARGVLGNALGTELIFSASLWQWRHIVALRKHAAADEEICAFAEEIEGLLPA